MARELDTVVKLQRNLGALREAERELAGVPEWMGELHTEHTARSEEIAAVEAEAEEATLQRRRAETASAEAEARLRHFHDQVSQVRTQREYSAILQEIDTVKAQIRELEEQALGEIERYDEAQQRLQERRAAFVDLDERYQGAQAQWEREKPEVERRAADLRREIDELRAALPAALLALFDRILEHRGGDATAAVRQAEAASGRIFHCGACNYRVRLQLVTEIARGVLVQCDGCKRILFVDEA